MDEVELQLAGVSVPTLGPFERADCGAARLALLQRRVRTTCHFRNTGLEEARSLQRASFSEKACKAAGFWLRQEISVMVVEERLLESVRLWLQLYSGIREGPIPVRPQQRTKR
jgi:hypothetical protein